MRCPRCNASAAEGAAICAQCDAVLDPAKFAREHQEEDDAAHESDADRTDVGPAPTAAQAAQTARARAAAAAARRAPAAALRPAPSAKGGAAEPRRPYLADAPGEAPPDPLEEARRSVDELAAFFRSLTFADRASAGASLLLIFLCMLPWRWTKADDDAIGLVAAFPAALLSGCVLGLVYFRARRATAALAVTLQRVQLFCALVLTAFCAWFIRSSTDERILHGAGKVFTSVVSSPDAAAYLGCAAALVALFASAATAFGNRSA